MQAPTQGFRNSERYLQRNDLLHHFYEPFPRLERFREDAETAG